MSRCEDYPCCGHGPAPLGDGGGCPDASGRFDCVECGRKLPLRATSAICAAGTGCRTRRRHWDEDDHGGHGVDRFDDFDR